MRKYIFVLASALLTIGIISCSKSENNTPPVVLSTDEFVKYTVNGVSFSFIRPADSLFSADQLDNPPPPPTTLVYATRIPTQWLDFVAITFERTGVGQGSTPILRSFFTKQTDIYPQNITSTNPIPITITEYGNVGEYISGNFSCLLKGPPPSNNQYNVTLNFRVKRKI